MFVISYLTLVFPHCSCDRSDRWMPAPRSGHPNIAQWLYCQQPHETQGIAQVRVGYRSTSGSAHWTDLDGLYRIPRRVEGQGQGVAVLCRILGHLGEDNERECGRVWRGSESRPHLSLTWQLRSYPTERADIWKKLSCPFPCQLWRFVQRFTFK